MNHRTTKNCAKEQQLARQAEIEKAKLEMQLKIKAMEAEDAKKRIHEEIEIEEAVATSSDIGHAS